jgi:phosphoribosylaminoimidazolecarboxamide formyltransferase/IMP cyclohydrolase
MRAVLSVYDKTGLVAFATGLVDLGVEIVSSGGTSRALEDAGIAHREVAEVTGAPEMLGGRVKTLHPAIHGGILADRTKPDHLAALESAGIGLVDLVVCNLYPFADAPSIEMIDVGGPTMVRAAAKNHEHVAVVVDPGDYGAVLDELRREGSIGVATRRRLARAAFAHTAAYDAAIVGWLDGGGPWGTPGDVLPASIHISLERCETLRYGENPHQHGARYRRIGGAPGWLDAVVQHGGRELSYLNLFDADAAWQLVHELVGIGGSEAAAVIVKHANPCGVAIAGDLATAYTAAFAGDPVSAFGGVVALSGRVDRALGESIVANALADVLVAHAVDEDALELFARKRKNMRVLTGPAPSAGGLVVRQLAGGYLVQEPDVFLAGRDAWRIATRAEPAAEQWADVELAWRSCARTSSNAIVLANGGQVVGVGCGQQSRVDAAEIAARKAAGRAAGGVAASDAFFPFRDGLDAVADAGVTVVVQPGGSLRDDEVVAAADERGIAMIVTGERHFRH